MTDLIPHSLVRTLRDIPLFHDVPEDDLLDLVGESANLYWADGERVFEAGDDPAALFVIVSGEVAVGADRDAPARVGPGTSLGEDAVTGKHPYPESAWVTEEAELMVIPAAIVRRVLGEEGQA